MRESGYQAAMQLITKTADLEKLCGNLRSADFVTVDTEFVRTSTYWPDLCLIQVAGPEDEAIIDPLADGLSLDPFWALMDDTKVLKVLHAARQDLEIFLHLSGRLPHPIFDTQIAAMVCGFGESVGYETLVRTLAKQSVDKTSRFTDWSRRPLTDKQLNYALSDVTHLRVIYTKLRKKLDETDRASWLEDENSVLEDPNTFRQDPQAAWQRLKVRGGNPKFLAILKAVAAWREEEAMRRNLPRNRVTRDDVLTEIAAHPPKDMAALKKVRALSSTFSSGKGGESLLAAVELGRNMPEDEIPVLTKQKPLSKGVAPIADMLKLLLKLKCDDHDVAPKLIASSKDLEALARDDDADIPALKGWRRELFGEDALAIKHGQLAMTLTNGRVKLVPTDGVSGDS